MTIARSTRPVPDSQTRRHVYTFADSASFARQLARTLGVGSTLVVVHRFPDAESLVRIRPPAALDAIVVRSLNDPNTKLIEVALAADALRRNGARRVTLVAPYLSYMRQDTVFAPGEPISQRVIGTWLGDTFDAVLTIEAHLHRVRLLSEVVPCRSRSLSAAPVLAQWIRHFRSAVYVVGPDEESRPWVQAIARTARLPWIVCRKQRSGDRTVRIELPALRDCRHAVIVDDMASSGATLAAVARRLHAAGVLVVDAAVVHALFEPGALARIRRAGVRRIVSCDTIRHPTNAIRSVPLIAAALEAARS